ncbi:MAG TPA: hypothetical protein VE075_10245 [Thermoanaerobaculia bacterium]|nr:hypothetical protein [Thermoanaerobaculia bacterium]
MSRSALPRCVAVSVLVLSLSSLAPAWASGKARPLAPGTPAAGAHEHAGAPVTFWSWLEALVGKAAGQPGGPRIVVEKGCANDPNGQCN